MFKTDLNDRERKRFAEIFIDIAESAQKIATALEEGDDDEFIKTFILFSLQSSQMMEISEILSTAVLSGKSDFPDFIKEE